MIEKIRLLFFILNELTCDIIKQTNKSEFVRNRNFEFSDELKTDILTVFFVDKEKVMCYLI